MPELGGKTIMVAERLAPRAIASRRLGVEIASGAVRSVLVIRGRVASLHAVSFADSDQLYSALCEILSSLRRQSWVRTKVFLAVGPSHSQLRRLVNLPPIRSQRALRQVVRAGAPRFFLKNGVPLITTDIAQLEGHEGWAAAVDEPPVRAMANACRLHRLRFELAAPAIVALKRVFVGGRLVSEDTDVRIEAELTSDGAIREVHRARVISTCLAAASSGFDGALETLGQDNAQYVCAYAVTLLDRAEPLAIHAATLDELAHSEVPAWRLLVAGACLMLTLLLVLTIPVVRANRTAARAAGQLASINRQYRAARWTENQLTRTTLALDEIEEFQRNRRSIIQALCELTNAVPPEAWLQSMRLDGMGGSLVALSPHAASVPNELAKLRSITSLLIVGAVSPEQLGQDRIERITLRFRWKLSIEAGRLPSSPSGTPKRC